jgi:hypothetical protein
MPIRGYCFPLNTCKRVNHSFRVNPDKPGLPHETPETGAIFQVVTELNTCAILLRGQVAHMLGVLRGYACVIE